MPTRLRSWLLRKAGRRPAGPARTAAEYTARMQRLAAEGRHRVAAGGMWDEMGPLVLAYLVDQGLEPGHRLLDIGCGPLRIGIPLIDYLEAGHYFGIDAMEGLLAAGYDVELAAAGLQHKLPRSHLLADDSFDAARLLGQTKVDVALAQSVFSHLPPRLLRTCLERLAPVMVPGGVFHATCFVVDDAAAEGPVTHEPGGKVTFRHQNPYHYTLADIAAAAAALPWEIDGPHDVGHPRAQSMVRFTRT